jgi:predicted dienelactone hydrolase
MKLLTALLSFLAAVLLAPLRLLAALFRRQPRTQNAIDACTRPGPHGVGVTTLKLVDKSRRIERNYWYRGNKHRALPTEVWYPSAGGKPGKEKRNAPIDGGAGPYPLIIFAHGLAGVRRQSASFCRHLASRGYVVAAPDFPLSKFWAPGGANVAAVLQQPRDVSFVLDRLLAMSATAGDKLSRAIDEERIGMSGHSLGGLTSLLVAYGVDRDRRVGCIVPFAAPGWFVSPEVSRGTRVPAMIIGGTKDKIVNPASIRAGYEASSAPKWWIEIAGAEHMRFADVPFTDRIIHWMFGWLAGYDKARAHLASVVHALGGDMDVWNHPADTSAGKYVSAKRQRELMRGFATPFFDALLKGDEEAATLLRSLEGMAPEVRIESEDGQWGAGASAGHALDVRPPSSRQPLPQ